MIRDVSEAGATVLRAETLSRPGGEAAMRAE
jgi:hypothetical protein